MTSPSVDLLVALHKAYNGRAIAMLEPEEQDAFRERVLAVENFDDLSAEDQALIARCHAEVDAGASVTWTNPEAWSDDWAAEDAAVEAADDPEVKALGDDDWVGL